MFNPTDKLVSITEKWVYPLHHNLVLWAGLFTTAPLNIATLISISPPQIPEPILNGVQQRPPTPSTSLHLNKFARTT